VTVPELIISCQPVERLLRRRRGGLGLRCGCNGRSWPGRRGRGSCGGSRGRRRRRGRGRRWPLTSPQSSIDSQQSRFRRCGWPRTVLRSRSRLRSIIGRHCSRLDRVKCVDSRRCKRQERHSERVRSGRVPMPVVPPTNRRSGGGLQARHTAGRPANTSWRRSTDPGNSAHLAVERLAGVEHSCRPRRPTATRDYLSTDPCPVENW
jgi:hypothetical protein